MESKIIKLPEDVINRIAAGEVIQRPANVVKELIENSLDANATQISVTVKEGGIKSIQLQDDGKGISKCDYSILCERFTTSKLNKFEDLQQLNTYGFRGEALASITHSAHVTITSKTAQSQCAYKAQFKDGSLVCDPRPCAGNVGTIIIVEDLFYNMPVRKNALKTPNEEYGKITEIVTKYAIHNAKVGFLLKKHGDTAVEIRTPCNSTPEQNIGLIYGTSLSNELIPLPFENVSSLCFTFRQGLISSANYTSKKYHFLLFINNRLIDSTNLKKAIELVFCGFVPKDQRPFCYLNLEIAPHNIDVNVHPTKKEVHFLNETEIVEKIQNMVETKLLEVNTTRTYHSQSALPTVAPSSVSPKKRISNDNLLTESSKETAAEMKRMGNVEKAKYDYQLVRTDSKERTLDNFVSFWNLGGDTATGSAQKKPSKPSGKTVETSIEGPEAKSDSVQSTVAKSTPAPQSKQTKIATPPKQSDETKTKNESSELVNVIEKPNFQTPTEMAPVESKSPELVKANFETPPTEIAPVELEIEQLYEIHSESDVNRRFVNLSSVRNLTRLIIDDTCSELRLLVRSHVFVGCVDGDRALIQHATGLFMINVQRFTEELFYQTLLFRLGNLNMIQLSQSAPLDELFSLHNSVCASTTNGVSASDFLTSKANLLYDYFSLNIKNGKLLSFPDILSDFTPQLESLPKLISDLVLDVDWSIEQKCLDDVARCLARFLSFKGKYCPDDDSWRQCVEQIIFPAIKLRLLPPKKWSQDGTVTKLTDLQELYKIFERC